jgi:hypothetical protein
MIVQRSLAVWERPGQTQEQSDRRLAEIGGKVEPLDAKFADFLDQYSQEEMLAITLGLEPVESGCFRLWLQVFYQGGRRIALAGEERPEFTLAQTAIAGLLSRLTWPIVR